MAQQEQQVYKILDSNESNGNNNYYIVQDENERKYVVMHIINGKYCIYDYEFHDIIKVFGTWYANNGTACCILKPQHIEAIPDLPFELNKLVYMHILIKEYCLKEPKQNEKHVLHHINERRRDNRRENLIWVSKNQQRALLKKIGKFDLQCLTFQSFVNGSMQRKHFGSIVIQPVSYLWKTSNKNISILNHLKERSGPFNKSLKIL
jgi:hypothetical protein